MSLRMKIIPFAAFVASLLILPQTGNAAANFDGFITADFQIGIEPGQASVDNNNALAWVTYYSGNAQNLIDQENTGQSPTAYVMTPDGHASAEVSGVFEGTSGQPASPFYLTLTAAADGSAGGSFGKETTALGSALGLFTFDNTEGTSADLIVVDFLDGRYYYRVGQTSDLGPESAEIRLIIKYEVFDANDISDIKEQETLFFDDQLENDPNGSGVEVMETAITGSTQGALNFSVPEGETWTLRVFAEIYGIAEGVVAPTPSIPEPTTLALFGLGLAGLGAIRRKKLAA